MSDILFPQPVAPGNTLKEGAQYWIAIPNYLAFKWLPSDQCWLDAGLVYLTEAERDQRLAYEQQENAKRIIPQWFRDLGPDVEVNQGLGWVPASWGGVSDWSAEKPKNYRAKPKQIVRGVIVDGVLTEYRWAPTVEKADANKSDLKYCVNLTEDGFEVDSGGYGWGERVHLKHKDADAMCAALNAVLGVK